MKEKEFLPLISNLGIERLTEMQERMLGLASECDEIILLSPTGSGKTLAFALPILKWLRLSTGRVQAIVIVPTRELVIQISQVLGKLTPGHKVSVLYGGHKVEDEVNSLKETPDIIVATPGRLLDHIRRRNIDVLPCRIVVLDEFDKSLELGFEDEMKHIFSHLKNVSKYILTSATNLKNLPEFIPLNSPRRLDYLKDNSKLKDKIKVYKVVSSGRDKLATLLELLNTLSVSNNIGKTIVFVNYRESAQRVYDFLKAAGASVALYHGALDQTEREKAIALFNNGTAPILVSTDLGSRGLDIADVENIIHYHIPISPETYTHRNGRTARMSAEGNVYVIVGPQENLPEFVGTDGELSVSDSAIGQLNSGYTSLYINAGKKEKLSKGDILGFLTKTCDIPVCSIGKIDVWDHYSLVAITESELPKVIEKGNTHKVKGVKRRIFTI